MKKKVNIAVVAVAEHFLLVADLYSSVTNLWSLLYPWDPLYILNSNGQKYIWVWQKALQDIWNLSHWWVISPPHIVHILVAEMFFAEGGQSGGFTWRMLLEYPVGSP